MVSPCTIKHDNKSGCRLHFRYRISRFVRIKMGVFSAHRNKTYFFYLGRENKSIKEHKESLTWMTIRVATLLLGQHGMIDTRQIRSAFQQRFLHWKDCVVVPLWKNHLLRAVCSKLNTGKAAFAAKFQCLLSEKLQRRKAHLQILQTLALSFIVDGGIIFISQI